jgi:hypothetical protein
MKMYSAFVNSMKLVFAIFVCGCCFEFALAQEKADAEKEREFDITDSLPGGGVFTFGQSAGTQNDLVFRFENSQFIRIAELRLISFSEVQKELELTKGQLEQLKKLRQEVHAYDMVWKWEQAIICESAKEKALAEMNKLKGRMSEAKPLKEILLPHQMDRLKQIQRRFLLFAYEAKQNRHLTTFAREFVSKRWKINSKTLEEISRAVHEHLAEIKKKNNEWDKSVATPRILAFFDGDDQRLLTSLIDGRAIFTSHPLLRNAQMSPFFLYREVEAELDKPNEYPSIGVKGADGLLFDVIDPMVHANGRLGSNHDFSHRSELAFSDTKWQRVALLLRFGKSEWFSLADFQSQELEHIAAKNEGATGGFYYSFLGSEEMIMGLKEIRNNSPLDSDEAAYRKYVDAIIEYKKSSDSKIEAAIRKTLLPHQLSLVQFSIAAPQLEKLGLYILLDNDMLGEQRALSNSEKKELTKLVSDRRAEEIAELNKLESQIVERLTPEERKVFKDLFGKPVEFLPPFILAFEK